MRRFVQLEVCGYSEGHFDTSFEGYHDIQLVLWRWRRIRPVAAVRTDVLFLMAKERPLRGLTPCSPPG